MPKKAVPFIPAWVDDLGLSVHAFRIYARIARRWNAERGCDESGGSMAEACHMHRDSVFKALNELDEVGLIKRTPRSGKTTRIDLVSPDEISAGPVPRNGAPPSPESGQDESGTRPSKPDGGYPSKPGGNPSPENGQAYKGTPKRYSRKENHNHGAEGKSRAREGPQAENGDGFLDKMILELTRRDVARPNAVWLARRFSPERVMANARLYDEKRGTGFPKGPGWLVAAVREGYVLPTPGQTFTAERRPTASTPPGTRLPPGPDPDVTDWTPEQIRACIDQQLSS